MAKEQIFYTSVFKGYSKNGTPKKVLTTYKPSKNANAFMNRDKIKAYNYGDEKEIAEDLYKGKDVELIEMASPYDDYKIAKRMKD